jgi:ribonuclease Z
MPKLIILGTATNVPDETHENSHMVLVGEDRMVLIDGPGSPYLRLRRAGLDETKLTDIIATHFHPDHVSGIPTLLMGLGLSKHENQMNVYANSHCMFFLKQMLDNFEWDTWHFFPVDFYTVPDKELHVLIDTDEFRLLTSPVKHFIPTLGIRIEFKKSGKVFAYSCDTAPTESIYDLAKDADIFVHEAAGASIGHSSAKQAGEAAKEAGVKEMFLIHYPVNGFEYQKLAEEAAEVFGGSVKMTEDFMEFEF